MSQCFVICCCLPTWLTVLRRIPLDILAKEEVNARTAKTDALGFEQEAFCRGRHLSRRIAF